MRLACVRHAASVRSEPGSNSNVKSLPFGFELLINRSMSDIDSGPY